MSTQPNLLSGLTSLDRLSKSDQRVLEARLRSMAAEAKKQGAVGVAAGLLRAVYELAEWET